MKKRLSLRERQFIDEYVKDLDPTQAAIRAGYAPSSAGQTALLLLARDDIVAGIRVMLGPDLVKAKMTRELALQRLTGMALGRMDQVAEWGEHTVRLKPSSTLPRSALASIKKIKGTLHGPAIELHDPLAAMKLIADMEGWLLPEAQKPNATQAPALIINPIKLESKP